MQPRRLQSLSPLLLLLLLPACAGDAPSAANPPGQTPEKADAGQPPPRGGATPVAGGTAAEPYLAQARAKAKAWQSDADLRGVSLVISDDADAGAIRQYFFFSRARQKGYVVAAAADGSLKGEEHNDASFGSTDPLPETFLPSQRALAAAQKAGFTPQGVTMMLSKQTGQRSPAWEIHSNRDWGAAYVVDAASEKVLSAPAAPSAEPTLAKTYLAKARAMAKAWQADAELRLIQGSFSKVKGQSGDFWGGGWEYLFYSPKSKKSYSVPGESLDGIQHTTVWPGIADLAPLSDDFLDSNEALAKATKLGLAGADRFLLLTLSADPADADLVAALLPEPQSTAAPPRPVWKIKDQWAGASDALVDAKTGNSLLRPYGAPPGAGLYLEITPPENLAGWLPKGSSDASKPGDTLVFKARLRGKPGAQAGWGGSGLGGFAPGLPVPPAKPAPPAPADKVTVKFTLDSSTHPGICMNYPLPAAADWDADLRFLEKESSPGLVISSPKRLPPLRMQCVAQREQSASDRSTFQVAVGCFDFGASAKLQVEASVPVVILGEAGKNPIAIPRDDNDNWIADAWEKNKGLAAAWKADHDDDVFPRTRPDLGGKDGDGLPLFEEYRGFYISGKHTRTHPLRKDVFLYDQHGLGLGYFEQSKLKVHLVQRNSGEFVNAPDPGADNPWVINFNREWGKLPRKKYVLHLVNEDLDSDSARRTYLFDGDAWGLCHPRRGVPRQVQKVIVDKARHLGDRKELNNTIAHELAHACNVPHHGRGWYWELETLELWQEDPRRQQWLNLDHLKDSMDVAPPRSQFSGVQNCIMRYASPGLSESPTQPHGPGDQRWERPGKLGFLFYRWKRKGSDEWIYGTSGNYLDEPGTFFCSSQRGTGVNHPDAKPWPEAGEAARDCGMCRLRLCVNDSAP